MMAAAAGPKLFAKELTATDVHHRLSWPAEHLPELPDFNGGHQVEFVAKDIAGKRWAFRCSKRTRGRYEKPVISGGWRGFLRSKGRLVKAGDEVAFYWSADADAHFHVRLKRKVLLLGVNINDSEE